MKNLPKGWEIKKLGEITNNFDGKRKPLSRSIRSERKGEYRYYGATEIVDYIDDYLFDGEYLLIGEDGANLLSKNRDLAFIVKGKFWVNNHAHVLNTKDLCDIKYLEYYFNSLNINEYVTGTAQPKLNQANLNKIPVYLPPLETQQRIVTKIEELFSELDKGVEELKKTQEQLKTYRQSVLKWAFEGRFTNENVKDGELPEGWEMILFNDFSKLQRGHDLPLAKIQKGEFPVITSAGINGYHNEYKANGPCLTTGRSGSVGNINYLEVEKYWPHNTVLFVKDFCGNAPKFVYYYYKQFNFKKYSASTAVPTLDRKQLFHVEISKPPLNEQHQIIQEIESRLSVADKLEEQIKTSLQQAEALRQSILKKAFEGELVR